VFADFFIKRPVFAVVCSIVVLLAGALAIPFLPVAQYPQIALPQVVVTSNYTGASAEVVESAVTIPLEQAINGAEGMKYISSVSNNNGTSTITVTFDAGRDLDIAAVDVQNRVSTATARLPNEVKQTGVTVTKSSSDFVLAMALYAEHGEYDQQFISNYADVFLKDAIKRVPGVGDVRIFGERKFAMRIWLDPSQLARRGLTASDVVQAISEQNAQVPAGQLGAPPSPATREYQISLQVAGRLAEAADFDNIVLTAAPDGSLVRLGDVGRAELGAEDYSTVLRFNGKQAVGLGVLQLPNANSLRLRQQVLDTVAEASKRFPPGLKWVDAFDTTRAVAASIREVILTLLGAIALVVGVIYVFLQSGTSTLIPSVTIPVSLVGTFAFVRFFGFSINTLTLFGLTLATGLVVDDAIVVIENIQRFIDEKGMTVRAAAAAAMKEVTGAVVATSLVLMAVFTPVAFLPGTTGRIYQQFSLTIAFSVGLSLFNSLTLTPALSARLLHKTPERKFILFRAFDRVFQAGRRAYLRTLRWLLGRPPVTLAAYAAVLGLGVLLFLRVPTGFLPEEDSGYFIVMAQAPSGTSLGYTRGVLRQAERTLRTVPEVQNLFQVGGFSFAGSGPNRAIMFVTLKPWDERTGPGQSMTEIIKRLRGPLLGNQQAVIVPFAPPAIRGVGSVGGFQFEIEDRSGNSIQRLAEVTGAVLGEASQSPKLAGIFTGFTADDPQLLIQLNRRRTKELNLALSDVFDALQTYIGSRYVTDFTFSNRSYRVYVQADQAYRGNPRDLTSLYARTHGGPVTMLSATGLPLPGTSPASRAAMVSLDHLIQVEPRVTAAQINHYNLFRSTEVNGAAATGVSSGEAIAEMERVARARLPGGFGYEWTGVAQEQLESGKTTVAIVVLALVLVFLVLAAQYESFSLPFVVLLSVPLGLVGAFAAQLIRHLVNDVFGQVGLVMLIGLSAKNAILIVEFANQLRARGYTIEQAALEASRERLRPILMTSFAFILGVLPLVIASGAGAESRHSMGTTVFGGMLLSTNMNLFFVPALYALIERLRERVRGRREEGGEALGAHV
jgi:HAE1 family hydrophobic/amphiphilic exporter-1